MMFHILKDHREKNEVPHLCTLCGFKAFTNDQLVKHVQTYQTHKKIWSLQNPREPVESFFKANINVREIREGQHFSVLGQEDSATVWAEKPRRNISEAHRKSTVKSTVRVVRPPATTSTSNQTSTSKGEVQTLLQNLQGMVPDNILAQALKSSGIAPMTMSTVTNNTNAEVAVEAYDPEDPGFTAEDFEDPLMHEPQLEIDIVPKKRRRPH